VPDFRSAGGGSNELLDLAGSGRGFLGQLRFWGALLVVGGGVCLLVGAFLSLRNAHSTETAAGIEDGARPLTYTDTRSYYDDPRPRAAETEIVGRLVQADAVVVQGQRTWVYAPLVSERPGADEHPRVYFRASETAYNRAVVDKRFQGILARGLPPLARRTFESHGRAVGDDVYLLIDGGAAQRRAAAGGAILGCGVLIGLVGLLAFLFAVRRQRANEAESEGRA
jgi:hypothetical protein